MGKHIVLTGGGTAGHVTPNLALVPRLLEEGYQITYIGSYDGIEKELVEKAGLTYVGISSGKLRRQLSFRNVTDVFRVLRGIRQAKRWMRENQPDIVFSKGGFVTVPVIFGAAKYKIPIVIHESDLTPGLANKLSVPKATRICCNFKKTLDYLPPGRSEVTGLPIRRELLEGTREGGLKRTGFDGTRPVLMVMGGSLGALAINRVLHGDLKRFTEIYDVVHLCGRGKQDASLNGTPGYVQYEYVGEEMADLLALADVVVSRAGANAICELLALHKPNILIPLTKAASRGDQLLNAAAFHEEGYSYLLPEEELTADRLLAAVQEVSENKDRYLKAMESSGAQNAVEELMDMFRELTEKNIGE